MLNRIRPFLLASLALAFVGQHVAAQNADEAISEKTSPPNKRVAHPKMLPMPKPRRPRSRRSCLTQWPR
jgi:hypothetical protein